MITKSTILKNIMDFAKKMDAKSGSNYYKYGKYLYHAIDKIFNTALRIIDKYRITIYYRNNIRPIKLHLGCGEQHKIGFLNIDWRKTNATDFVCDIRNIPLSSGSVSVIENYHVIEHLSRNDAIDTLTKWYNLLESGGCLVIECPDFDGAVKEYIDGNDNRIYNIFGYQRFPGDTHLFGYNYKRLKQILSTIGYEDIKSAEPQDYHVMEEPCLRIEAKKGK